MDKRKEYREMSQPASPGLGPSGNVTPSVPSIDQPASPGLGPSGGMTPSVPSIDQPASPGLGPSGGMTPSLPSIDQPASPGLGPSGNVTPSLPSWNVQTPIFPELPMITRIGYVRFFNGYPSAVGIDIYVNGELMEQNLRFGDTSQYFTAMPGTYRITIYRTGMTGTPLLTARMTVRRNGVYTAAFIGGGASEDFLVLNDRTGNMNENSVFYRFVAATAAEAAFDVYIDDVLMISYLTYPEVSGYLRLSPGRHYIRLYAAGTESMVYEGATGYLTGGNAYTGFIVGSNTTRPGVRVITVREGGRYLRF